MSLAEFWFVLVAFLFAGYFFLEGFDFGVGMLLPVLGKDDTGRRVMINTIGPVWDMNETWLIVAGASHVRRLPVLVRHPVQRVLPAAAADPGRVDRARGRVRVPGQDRRYAVAAPLGRLHRHRLLVPALLWGVAFANILRGVPIDADGNFTGTLFTLLNPFGLLGGLAMVTLFCTYGAIFVALKTVGTIRQRARDVAARIGGIAVLLGAAFLVWSLLVHGDAASWVLGALTAAALVAGLVANARGREGRAFSLVGGAVVGLVATLFVALFRTSCPRARIRHSASRSRTPAPRPPRWP